MADVSRSLPDQLRWTWRDGALGQVLLACSRRGLCYLGLVDSREPQGLDRWARRVIPGARLSEEDAQLLGDAARQLDEYAEGQRRGFDLPLDLRGTAFQLAVWRELRAIPYGTTCTYGHLAARLGRPGASRAVGLAAGRNPLPVIVPCHRLVAAGGLGGFSAGLERKRFLLAREGAVPQA